MLNSGADSGRVYHGRANEHLAAWHGESVRPSAAHGRDVEARSCRIPHAAWYNLLGCIRGPRRMAVSERAERVAGSAQVRSGRVLPSQNFYAAVAPVEFGLRSPLG